MSQETKDVTSGVVTTIGDSDLVMVAGAGGWSPIKFADLAKAVRGTLQIGGRNLVLRSGDYRGFATSTYKGLGVCSFGNWSHPTLSLSETIEAGEIVTVSFYAKGISYISNLGYMYPKDITKWERISRTFSFSQAFSEIRIVRPLVDDDPTGSTSICGIKLERGNIATDWSPAPEDIASGNWGGVNRRFTISYNLHSDDCGKGGAHEPDFGAGRRTEECADGVLSFGTLDALCEFIGNTPENLECLSLSNDHNMHQRGRSSHRLVKNCNFHNESSIRYKWKRRISSDNGLRWSSQDADFFPICVRSLPICSEIRLNRRRSKQHVGDLVSTGVYNLKARKEVAYAD